tara:strand:- start:23 stop:370 length:348 start_codon:yes stop_codon:yes gene_type:complete
MSEEHQPKIREYDKVKYSDKDLMWATSKVAVSVFFLAMIYFRFLAMEITQEAVTSQQNEHTTQLATAIKLLSDKDNENIDYLNDRMDKKTKRIEDDVLKVWGELEKLKLPNSDKD